MPATARSTLLRELANDLFREHYLEFTALATSTTSILHATELRTTRGSVNSYDDGYIYVYGGTAGGDERRVDSYTPTQTTTYGALTPVRVFSAAPDATSTCFAYTGPLSVTELKRIINKALRRMRRQRLLGLTLVTDGMMEATGTTDWTATGAALSKVTTVANIYEGAQALFVDNSATDGRARSALINCIPGEVYQVSAVVRVGNTSGTHTATLRAYDETGAASIQTGTTVNRERTRLQFDFTIPSGSRQFSIRLEGSAAATDTYWDQVFVWRPRVRQFFLPSDVDRFDQVLGVYQLRPKSGSASGESRATDALAVDFDPVVGARVLPDPTAASPFMLDLARSTWAPARPLLIDCLLPWAELTTDAGTTYATQDDVTILARGIAYDQLAADGPKDDRDYYSKLAEKMSSTWLAWSARQPRPATPVRLRR